MSQPLKRSILLPKHPERVCWGCDRYCPADDLSCGNGSIRTPHLCELFGDDWQDFSASSAETETPKPTEDVAEIRKTATSP